MLPEECWCRDVGRLLENSLLGTPPPLAGSISVANCRGGESVGTCSPPTIYGVMMSWPRDMPVYHIPLHSSERPPAGDGVWGPLRGRWMSRK